MSTKPEIPECLKRHGITEVTDNLKGKVVDLKGKAHLLGAETWQPFFDMIREKREKEENDAKGK